MKRLIVFSLVMVFMACLIIAQQQKPNIVNKDVFDEIEEEAWQEIDKILQKVIDADTDE